MRHCMVALACAAGLLAQHRTLVVVVDDLGISADRASRIRTELQHLVAGTDRVFVLPTSGYSSARPAAGAIARVQYDPTEVPPAAAIDAARAALEYALAGLRAVPGRKAVLLLSESQTPLLSTAIVPLADAAKAVSASISVTSAGFAELAQRTGGRVLASGGDLSAALDAALPDFEPPALYRPIAAFSPETELFRGLSSPFADEPLGVTVAANHMLGKSGSMLQVEILVDGRKVSFACTPGGPCTGVLEIEAGLYDPDRATYSLTQRAYTLKLTGAGLDDLRANGLATLIDLPVRRSGACNVRVSVRDALSGRIGSAAAFAYAPETLTGNLVLTGVTIKDSNGSVRRDDSFEYSYQIVNLKHDEEDRSLAESQARLYCDGRLVFQGKPTALRFSPSKSNVRTVAATVKLGANANPGHYVLRIDGTDKLAQDRTATVTFGFDVK